MPTSYTFTEGELLTAAKLNNHAAHQVPKANDPFIESIPITVPSDGPVTGTATLHRVGMIAFLVFDLTGEISTDTQVLTLPAGYEAPDKWPGTEYQYGTHGNRPTYHNGVAAIRIPTQPGTTRRFGQIAWPLVP